MENRIVCGEHRVHSPKRVLLVIANDAMRRDYSAFLTIRGYHVTAAANGLSAIKRLEKQGGRFSFMITDLIIPDISGLGIISIVKKNYPRITVIALTEGIQVLQQMAKEFRADLVLTKPINPADFGDAMDRFSVH